MELLFLFKQQSWIWIICSFCLLLRVVLECNGSYEFKFKLKKTIKKIGFLYALILLWSFASDHQEDDKLILGLFIVTYFYIIYLLVEKCAETGGYTSSFLLMVNCIFITILSFTNEITSIIGAICTSIISIFIFKYWTEDRSDFAENLALCIETIITSVFLKLGPYDSFYYTLLYLFISETLLDVINKGIKYVVKVYWNEDNEY